MRIRKMVLSMLLGVVFAGVAAVMSETDVQAAGEVAINETNFPDAEFREFVSCKMDKDRDGILSETECAGVTCIDLYGEVTSVKGIEYFPNLQELNCSYTEIDSLDVSKNPKLTELNCSWTNISSLDLSKNEYLKGLECCGNRILSLDLSKNTYLGSNEEIGSDGEIMVYEGETVCLTPQIIDVPEKSFSIDLKAMDPNFELSKVTAVSGAVLNGTVLSGTIIDENIPYYEYDCSDWNMRVYISCDGLGFLSFGHDMPLDSCLPIYYIKDGKICDDYTGLVKCGEKWYFVQNGKAHNRYTGLCYHNGAWYYVQDGVLNWNATGLCYHNGGWYYVQKGVVNFKYTGLCYRNGNWYYVQNGVLNWNATGLCYRNGGWYFVQNGVVNFKYNGLCKRNGNWYYVQNGVVNWNYTGYAYGGGLRWYVRRGIMVHRA